MIYQQDTSIIGNLPISGGGGGGAASWGAITGTLTDQTDLYNALQALDADNQYLLEQTFQFKHKVKTKIDNIYSYPANIILTTTGVADLQTSINALTEGQILEIQTNASYDPIVIPTTKKIIIRAGIGWLPKIAGARAIRLSNGADDVVISGLILENNTLVGGNLNEQGACVTFNTHQTIVNDIIFHNITMKTIAVLGSAVLLSYHWSASGDLYYNPPQLAELSNNVAFVGCNVYKGCTDGNEGACFCLRGMKNCYIADNYIDNDSNNGRGVQLQGVLSALIENNKIYRIGGTNAEAIKIDEIGTSPFVQTAYIAGNYTEGNIEGIDVDDAVSAIVIDNTCTKSTNEGISLDDSSRLIAINNSVYNCRDGILFEAGSTGYLANNNVFNNYGTNYKMDNGYTPDASNVSTPSRSAMGEFYQHNKALTEATLINLIDLYVGNNKSNSVKITYMIEAINTGTNVVECHYGEFIVICVNQNGTVTNASNHPTALEVDLPIGVGITDVFGVVNGTGKVTVNLTATSGITPTSMTVYFNIECYGTSGYVLL